MLLVLTLMAAMFPLLGAAYEEKTGTITCTPGYVVNMRSNAGTDNPIVCTLERGDRVTIIGEDTASDGLWYNITYSGKTGWVRHDFVIVDVNYVPDGDFEAYLDEQGFPESYKDGLRQLHAQYPNWVFKAMHTGYDWDYAVSQEDYITASTAKSLVENSMPSSWKSTEPGAYNWETGTWIFKDAGRWVCASTEIVEYYMDPRNFLDSTNIFQFMTQGFDSSTQTVAGVQTLLDGTFMENPVTDTDGKTLNYAEVIYELGRVNNVNPYVLATMIITEQSRTGSDMVSGTCSYCPGYFNFFNVNASGSTAELVLRNGLNYAKSQGWSTRYKAIIEGASFYASDYVNDGQTTLYLKRFNVQGSNPFWHQYMTSIYGAAVEGANLSSVYSGDIRNTALSFYIPVYENMPETACPQPTGDGSPDNRLASLSVDGYSLTPSFSVNTASYDLVVPSHVNSVTINASAVNSSATISGTGSITLTGTLTTCVVRITSQDGRAREYTINIAREYDADIFTNNYSVNATYISGIPLNTSKTTFENSLVANGSATVVTSSGASKDTETLCTGDKVYVYDTSGSIYGTFDIVIRGDVSGDGKINTADMILVRNHVIGASSLIGCHTYAADSNKDGKINTADMITIRNHIIGMSTITQ
jgi:beta-N-acetylglucosaminidase